MVNNQGTYLNYAMDAPDAPLRGIGQGAPHAHRGGQWMQAMGGAA